MKKFPVAIQIYSVRDDAQANLFGTLKKLKEMGYDGVEFAGLYGHTPEEVRDMCKALDIVPLSAHVPYLDMVKDPEGCSWRLQDHRLPLCRSSVSDPRIQTRYARVSGGHQECRHARRGLQQARNDASLS